jgi:peptidoglycan/xylan/chitin deacetylase (PgdA/CDA1 family)
VSPAPITPFPAELQQEIAVLQAHHRLLFHGAPTRREIALTFDDGPNPFYTPAVLAILKRYRVQATFFCLGILVARYPQLVQQEHAAGHVVGDHSWSHPQLPLLTPSQILWQIRTAADTIQQVIEVRPTFFRPPYGDYDSQVLTQANRLGLTIVLWNDDPRDWSWPGTTGIISGVLTQAGNGSIILLHDGGGDRSQTVAALPTIIESLQRQGFRLVTLQQMVDEVHATLSRLRPSLKPPRSIALISAALLVLAWRCDAWALRRRCWLAARRLRVRCAR